MTEKKDVSILTVEDLFTILESSHFYCKKGIKEELRHIRGEITPDYAEEKDFNGRPMILGCHLLCSRDCNIKDFI